MSTTRKTENRWTLDAASYRALKAAALTKALRTSGHDALAATRAVRTDLVQLLAVYALFGAKGANDARRPVPGLDARAPSKHAGGDPHELAEQKLRNEAFERRLSLKAAGRASLSKARLARMAKASVS